MDWIKGISFDNNWIAMKYVSYIVHRERNPGMEGPPGPWGLLPFSLKLKTDRIGTERFCHLCYSCTENCLLSNDIHDYYFVSQGKTDIPGLNDGEELTITDVSCRFCDTARRMNVLLYTLTCFSSFTIFQLLLDGDSCTCYWVSQIKLQAVLSVWRFCSCTQLEWHIQYSPLPLLLTILYTAEVTQSSPVPAYAHVLYNSIFRDTWYTCT